MWYCYWYGYCCWLKRPPVESRARGRVSQKRVCWITLFLFWGLIDAEIGLCLSRQSGGKCVTSSGSRWGDPPARRVQEGLLRNAVSTRDQIWYSSCDSCQRVGTRLFSKVSHLRPLGAQVAAAITRGYRSLLERSIETIVRPPWSLLERLYHFQLSISGAREIYTFRVTRGAVWRSERFTITSVRALIGTCTIIPASRPGTVKRSVWQPCWGLLSNICPEDALLSTRGNQNIKQKVTVNVRSARSKQKLGEPKLMISEPGLGHFEQPMSAGECWLVRNASKAW